MLRSLCVYLLLCAAAVSAAAYDCTGADRAWCRLSAHLGELPNLASFLGGSGETGRRFANAAFNSAGSQQYEWTLFNDLLGGGKGDPGGRLIRSALARLPPEQWYYVIRLEDQRRILAGMGGGVYGNFVEGVGNLVRPEKYRMNTMKCFEQAGTLIRNAEPIKGSGRPRGVFNAWSALPVTARFRKLNEHTAPCFRFDGPGGPVEIVADPWANVLVPARAWWGKFDPSVPKALAGRPGVCGPDYDEWDGERARALVEAEDRAAARQKAQLDKITNVFGK
ncbi:MAG: hypothetical protein NTY45_00530 [Elusimicrobia bacterium]|nr:hypothetical protein [Elusimicrobiota bacterium]